MHKATAQTHQAQAQAAAHQTTQQQASGTRTESPQGERIAQLAGLAKQSPASQRLAQLTAIASHSPRQAAQRAVTDEAFSWGERSPSRQQVGYATLHNYSPEMPFQFKSAQGSISGHHYAYRNTAEDMVFVPALEGKGVAQLTTRRKGYIKEESEGESDSGEENYEPMKKKKKKCDEDDDPTYEEEMLVPGDSGYITPLQHYDLYIGGNGKRDNKKKKRAKNLNDKVAVKPVSGGVELWWLKPYDYKMKFKLQGDRQKDVSELGGNRQSLTWHHCADWKPGGKWGYCTMQQVPTSEHKSWGHVGGASKAGYQDADGD